MADTTEALTVTVIDVASLTQTDGEGRHVLERRLREAASEIESLRYELDQLTTTLGIAQARGTELMLENRELRAKLASGFLLPGWTCGSCLVFNGEGKWTLAVCRVCGKAKP